MIVSIALVGIGGYGETYLRELLFMGQDKGFRLAGAIDPNPDRCTHLADLQESGVPIYPDLDAFYQKDFADLVVISAPIHQHAPLTCLALSHGSNVLCEKPLAASLTDAQSMLEAEQASGKLIAIGYQWSFSDSILALKHDILAGRFGKPLFFKTLVLWPRWRSYYQRNNWAGRVRMENGSLVLDSPVHNAAAHYLHNMLFLLGNSLESSAIPIREEVELYRANPIENYDTAALRVTIESGIELLFLTAHPVEKEHGPLIQYEFEDATIEYPGADRTFQARLHSGQVISYGSPDATNANKLWHTLDAIQTGQKIVCGVQTALPQLICAAGAQRASISNFPQELILTQESGSERLIYVNGLYDTLLEGYRTGQMPSEIQRASWTRERTLIHLP